MAETLLPEVAALSGRATIAPVATRVVGRAFVQQLAAQELDRAQTPEALARRQRALVRLGALPAGTDLRRLLVDLYAQQAAGLYDPRTKTLYLANWIPESLQTTTVAHELVHALQDRQLDLASFLESADENSDAVSARQAVVEGEAVVIMQEHFVRHLLEATQAAGLPSEAVSGGMADLAQLLGAMGQSQAALEATPPFIRDGLLFPYLSGAAFVEAARAASVPATRLLADPPASTEQILHPERYLGDRDAPTALAAPPAAPLSGWTVVDTDVLGEAGWASLARAQLPAGVAETAAAGWDGDRYAYLEHDADGAWALVLWSVWDSVADASEWQAAVPRIYPHAIAERRSTRVVVLDGALSDAPAGTLEAWRRWAWRLWPSERSD